MPKKSPLCKDDQGSDKRGRVGEGWVGGSRTQLVSEALRVKALSLWPPKSRAQTPEP